MELVSNKHLSSISCMKCRYVGSKYMYFMAANSKKVRGSIETYIYELGGSLHAGVQGLDLFLFGLGIHGHRYVSTNMESSLNEV
jgi:hypothetical protein